MHILTVQLYRLNIQLKPHFPKQIYFFLQRNISPFSTWRSCTRVDINTGVPALVLTLNWEANANEGPVPSASSRAQTLTSECEEWGDSQHRNDNSPISEVTYSREEGRAALSWQGHQFHETFPPSHLKEQHNHAPGWCSMKWNRRPDPGGADTVLCPRKWGSFFTKRCQCQWDRPCRPRSERHRVDWRQNLENYAIKDSLRSY